MHRNLTTPFCFLPFNLSPFVKIRRMRLQITLDLAFPAFYLRFSAIQSYLFRPWWLSFFFSSICFLLLRSSDYFKTEERRREREGERERERDRWQKEDRFAGLVLQTSMQLGCITASNTVYTTRGSYFGKKSNVGPACKSSASSSSFPEGKTFSSLSFQPSLYMGQSLGLDSGSNISEGFSRRSRNSYVRANSDDLDIVSSTTVPASKGTVLPYVAIAGLGAILFGYHLGVVNGGLEYLAKDLGIASNTVLQGWVVSSTLAGATIGSFTGGALADKFGCTRTFQLDAIPLIVGAILSATSQGVQAMILGRFLVGLGIGVSSAVVPLYISEISPTEIRGALGSVNQLFICIGILVALVAGLPLAGNPIWWRTMFWLAVIPAVLLGFGMIFAPESPRWLFKQGKIPETENAIKKLWGKGKVESTLVSLRAGGTESGGEDAGWGDLFSKRYRKVVSIGAALFLFQQFAGINAVVYYSTAVFRSAGIQSDVAASALVGTANVLGTIVASSLMDKQGRKKLLITSFLGMALSMLVLSLGLSWPPLAAYSGTLAVVGTVSYILAFSLGAGPVPALLLPEIFASKIRAKAVSLSLGVHWVTNFIIGLYFLSAVNKFGVSTVYQGFAAVCVLAAIYIGNNVVETKGRSLEDIELELSPAA